eukprot:1503719-Pleurochrysis_carterae.AAC.1
MALQLGQHNLAHGRLDPAYERPGEQLPGVDDGGRLQVLVWERSGEPIWQPNLEKMAPHAAPPYWCGSLTTQASRYCPPVARAW